MSLAFAESRRLVAPVELQSMVPSVVATEASEARALVFQPALEEYEQNFVLAARTFAAAHPHSPAAAARLAQAEQVVGQTEAAVDAALDALRLTRKNADPAVSLAVAQVLIHSGEVEAAERAVGQMADGSVQVLLAARLAIRRGDLEGALACIGELDTLDALTMRGWLSLELRRFSDAVRLFRAALRKGGLNPTLLVNLAYAHAALGVRAKAIRETREAQALAPANRLIGLNLVAYYLADGEFDRALAEIKSLREQSPQEIRLAFAEADVHLLANEVAKAESTLRRARTSDLWVSADLAERAELTADLAFLEWRLGRRDREDAKRVVLDELERTDFDAFPISALLPALMRTSDEAPELASVCDRLAQRHPDESLYALRTQLAFLRSEFDEAARLAASWAADEILNPHAAAVAVYLLADVEGDFESAVALGRTALVRAGHTEELVNNVAYVLALAGKLSEADQLLPRQAGGSVFMTATRALVDILAGRIEQGMKGYDRAYELATKHSDPDLPQLVLANRQLALHRASTRGLVDLGEITVSLPTGWETHPHFALVKRKAEREGMDCSTQSR